MKATLYKNIDVIRIPVKTGVREYNFPRFTDWAEKKIDKIIFFSARNADTQHPILDPVTGIAPVYGETEQNGRDVFVNLVTKSGVDIANYLNIQMLNSNMQNAGVVEVNDVLNLSLCRIKMTSAPVKDMTIMCYVVWDSKEVEEYNYPTRSVTVEFPMAANEELTFRELLNTYVHGINMPDAKIKGLIAWSDNNNPAWLTLRDHKRSYIINNLNTQMAHWSRIDFNALIFGFLWSVREYPQTPPMLFDNIDIDFDYSRVRNALDKETTQILTFLY